MSLFRNNKLFKKVYTLLFLGIIFLTLIFTLIGASLQKKAILELFHSEAKSLVKSLLLIVTKETKVSNDKYILSFTKEYIDNTHKIKSVIIGKNNNEYLVIKGDSYKITQDISNSLKQMQSEKENSKIVYSEILKQNVFNFSYPVKNNNKYNWVHLSLDLKDYNDKVAFLYKQYTFLFIFFALFSFVISYYVARIFVKPIVELNEKVSQVNSDNLDLKIDEITDDELGELTKAFKSMITQLSISQKNLKQSQVELEKRVQERTVDLEKANSSLNEKSKELSELNKTLDNKVKKEIERREEQEQMLLQQSRLAAMGEMVGNIAHQWRQPLNALSIIIQNIDLSYRIGKLNEEFMKKSIDESLHLTTMMSKTIDDFRNFFSPNKKKKNFLLHESLDSSLQLIGSTFKNYNIKVERDIQKDLKVFGFPNEFSQALLNILSNAKDALIEKRVLRPKVIVSLKQEGKYGKISICDNAGGINDDIIVKIFEPYFTTKEQGKGTGIGLYMSKMIIEQNMKGKIFAKNIEKGVEFIILIPLKTEEKDK